MSENNVVRFEPRPKQAHAPALFVELRLTDDFRLEVSLHDSTGVVGTLEYGVSVVSPPDFDLNMLRTQWDRLREAPEDVA